MEIKMFDNKKTHPNNKKENIKKKDESFIFEAVISYFLDILLLNRDSIVVYDCIY